MFRICVGFLGRGDGFLSDDFKFIEVVFAVFSVKGFFESEDDIGDVVSVLDRVEDFVCKFVGGVG